VLDVDEDVELELDVEAGGALVEVVL